MKKIKRLLLAAALAGMFAPLMQSCKKGEGDPFLSLRSRKARLTGEWSVQSWEEESNYSSNSSTGVSSNGTDKIEIEDGDATLFTSYTSSSQFGEFTNSNTASGSGEITITINNDGTFTRINEMSLTYYVDGTVVAINMKTETNGTWDFLHGTGKDFKNRERVVLYILEEESTSTESADGASETYTNKSEFADGSYSETWLITTLKNKEIVFEADYSGSGSYVNTSSGFGSSTSESGSSTAKGGVTATMTRD